MTVAIHPLDPIAAAEAGIRGSKTLMATVADDLSQHERWLAHYQLAEKRHARRVMLQELLYQLDLARKRTMRFLKRTALLTLHLARRVAGFTSRTAVFVFVSIRDAVIACIDWLRPRAYALALLLRRWLVASWIWLAARSRAFAALAARWWSAAWAWTRVNAAIASSWAAATSIAAAAALRHWLMQTWRRTRAMARVLTRQSVYGAGIALPWIAATLRNAGFRLLRGLTWTAVNVRLFVRAARIEARRAASWSAPHARAAALALKRNLSEGAAWSATKATQAGEVTAHASLAAATRMSQSWAALKTRHASNGPLREEPPATGQTHRALVVRRSTAIICFEPRRPGLPAQRVG